MGNLLSFSSSSTEDHDLAEAHSLRQQASELYDKANSLSKQSQTAFSNDQKALAKDLSNQKNNIITQAKHKNKQAARMFFRYHNKDRGREEIDLHGLFENEVEEFMVERIRECKREKQMTLRVITGRGNNSINNISKLKPKIARFALEANIKFLLDHPNAGCITLELSEDTRVDEGWGCCIM